MSTIAVIADKGVSHLACPYFMPTQPAQNATFVHPLRLPLGGPWEGSCGASGHEQAQLTGEELRECNLGYASACTRLPRERASDAVRFSVMRESGVQIVLRFVCEKNYRPAGDGTLEYDSQRGHFVSIHPEPQIQKMAECYLTSYLSRKVPPLKDSTSSTNA